MNGTLKGVNLPISKLHSILAISNLLANNNITVSYVKVNSLRLKSNVDSKWATKHLWGYHLFCCWWYINLSYCRNYLSSNSITKDQFPPTWDAMAGAILLPYFDGGVNTPLDLICLHLKAEALDLHWVIFSKLHMLMYFLSICVFRSICVSWCI